MRDSFLLFFCFFLSVITTLSCHADVKTHSLDSASKELKLSIQTSPRLIKTQVTNPDVYRNINTHCGLEDKNGNLWFGTTGEGIYRFDGNAFTQFTIHDGLNSNVIWTLLEDKNGVIWIGTEEGLCKYAENIFTQVEITNALNGKSKADNLNNTVSSIYEDNSGKLWFGTKEGVFIYDGISFKKFPDNNINNDERLSLKSVQSILKDTNGDMWFGSGPNAFEGLSRFDGKNLISNKINGNENWIRNLMVDAAGTIWIGTRRNGVWIYKDNNFTPFMDGKYGSGVASLIDSKGNIWFSGGEVIHTNESDEGIWRYDGNSMRNFSYKDGFSKYSVWMFLEDSKGNIWIGTRNVGLYKYDGHQFTSYSEVNDLGSMPDRHLMLMDTVR